MGLENAPQQSLGRIDPSSIVAKADPNVVSPSAVAALTDAFRNGFITADDIVQRVGEVGKSKRKVEVQMNKEAVSPQAQQARQASMAQQAAQGQLGAAQANAMTPMVDQQAALAQSQLDDAQARQKYPASVFFDNFAPSLGLEVPLDANGKPDYAKKAQIGAQLAVWITDKEKSKAELANIDTHASADGTQLIPITKQGTPVPVSHVKELQDKVNKPFQFLPPGTSNVAPAPAAAAVQPKTLYGSDAQAAADAAERSANGLPAPVAAPAAPAAMVTPKTAAPGVKTPVGNAPVGTQLGDTAISLGPPKAKDMQDKAPTEAQQRAELALARFAQSNDMFSALRESGYDPTSIGSWMDGFLPQVLKSGDRKAYDAAVDAWSQGLLRLESGAAISRQEKTWYEKAFFPQVNDPPSVVESKGHMRRDIERMVGEIAQAGAVVSPESAAQVQRIYAQAGAKTGSTPIGVNAKPVTLSTGKKVVRGPDGKAYIAP